MIVTTIHGNIGRDAKVSALPQGTIVCEFTVAASVGYGDRKSTEWFQCYLFGKRAEGSLPQYLKKGVKVAVSGEQTREEWTGKDGKNYFKLKINVDHLDLSGGGQQQAPQAQPQQQGVGLPDADYDEELPF